MNYLGIDQSYTSSGIVVLNDENELVHASIFKTPKEEDIYLRAWKISEHIIWLIREYEIDAIGIEGLAFGMMGNATRDLAGLQFVIVSKVRNTTSVPIDIVTPLSVKKFATGNGKSKKKEMIAALPDDVLSHLKAENYKLTTGLADLADAYFIAQYIKHKDIDEPSSIQPSQVRN